MVLSMFAKPQLNKKKKKMHEIHLAVNQSIQGAIWAELVQQSPECITGMAHSEEKKDCINKGEPMFTFDWMPMP